MRRTDNEALDEALVQELVNYRNENKLRQRNYAELLKMEMREKELSRSKDKQVKIQDRLAIHDAVQKEKQQLQSKKAQRLQLEHLMQVDNLKLMNLHKQLMHTPEATLPKEHPFVRLVEQQDLRNNLLREKFKFQNHFNQMQEQIKKSQQEINKKWERDERAKYEQYVESDFAKREDSYKKLRLMHTDRERGHLDGSQLKKMDREAQQKYLEFLRSQVQEKNNRTIQQRTLNTSADVARVRNQSPDISSSPAFLGATPYSYDRKRQLEVLDKNFGFSIPKYLEAHSSKQRDFYDQERLLLSSRVNPQDLRARVNTQQSHNERIKSQQASPTNKDLKLPSLKDNIKTQNSPVVGRRSSSMAVRTQQPQRQYAQANSPPIKSFKTIKSYNFINGTINTHRVPS